MVKGGRGWDAIVVGETRAGTSAAVRRTGTGWLMPVRTPNKADAAWGRRAYRLEPDAYVREDRLLPRPPGLYLQPAGTGSAGERRRRRTRRGQTSAARPASRT
jgi:hypothetical protein